MLTLERLGTKLVCVGTSHEAMKEDVIALYEKETGTKPSADYVAETLRHISDLLLAEPPNRAAFVSDFGGQICILLGGFFSRRSIAIRERIAHLAPMQRKAI